MTCAVRVLWRRKTTTLTVRPRASAAISPKSRSKARTTRPSANCLREDFVVRKSVKTLFAEVNRLVTVFAKPRNDANVHTHIHKESHHLLRCLRADVDLLLSEPCSVFESLLNILALKVWVSG